MQKVFVLLLHFPPTMFYEPCFPALFYGWDFYYLDTIGQLPIMDCADQATSTFHVDLRWVSSNLQILAYIYM